MARKISLVTANLELEGENVVIVELVNCAVCWGQGIEVLHLRDNTSWYTKSFMLWLLEIYTRIIRWTSIGIKEGKHVENAQDNIFMVNVVEVR